MPNEMTMSCHCGAHSYTLEESRPASAGKLSLCHCDTCRWTTGALCISYILIAEPPSQLGGTTAYAPHAGLTMHFCSTCGCHLFRVADRDGREEWQVASGVLTSGPEDTRTFEDHIHVEDTKDGGLARWLQPYHAKPSSETGVQPGSAPEFLPAACHCGTVSFRISRPSETSRLPKSDYPDLMMPYTSTPPEAVRNPSDDKWWLREEGSKFLAGTCACRSCRTTLGFEVQAWAFVPRTNISFCASPVDGGEEENVILPLDFGELHRRGVLRGYISSEGVEREFCGRCGATVFWHDRWRPELIDVSVGLLRGRSGALVEEWLSWWKGRVSFEEDAKLGRTGGPAERAERLVTALHEGLGGDNR